MAQTECEVDRSNVEAIKNCSKRSKRPWPAIPWKRSRWSLSRNESPSSHKPGGGFPHLPPPLYPKYQDCVKGGGKMEVSLNITYRGDKLRSVREERGLSQSQLAARAGLSVRMLQDYEQGKRDFNGAKLKTILRICIALECKLEDVINEPETMDLLRQYGE